MRRFITCLFIIGFVGCSIQPTDYCTNNSFIITSKTKGLQPYYYQPCTDLFLKPVASSILDSLLCDEVDATHYAIKFYPKSIEEVDILRGIKDIEMSYIPFGFVPVSKEERLALSKYFCPIINDEGETIMVEGNYVISDNCNDDFSDNKDYSLRLPVFYSVWPINRSLPGGIRSEVINYVHLRERPDFPIHQIVLPLRLSTYDNLLNEYLPLENIKVHLTNGCGSYSNTYTGSNGTLNVNPYLQGLSDSEYGDLTVTLMLETPKWVIARNEWSTTPIHIPLGTVSDIWPFYLLETREYSDTLTSISTELEIHRAAQYYFNENHYLSSSVMNTEEGVYFYALLDTLAFQHGSSYPPYKLIKIGNYSQNHNEIMGTTFHELGHIRHACKVGLSNLYSSEGIIQESYASYVGWLIGEQYYLSRGFVRPYSEFEINNQNRQCLIPSATYTFYAYSPLFVDMVDDLNQDEYYSCGVEDEIENVPKTLVDSLGANSLTVADFFNSLSDYTGIYFTNEALISYKSYYL